MNQNNENLKWAVTCFRVIYVITTILCLMFIINGEWTSGITFGFLTLIIILLSNTMKNKNHIAYSLKNKYDNSVEKLLTSKYTEVFYVFNKR